MEVEPKAKNAKKKKFKLTKQLVRIALNDGWTQKDIATACRTQQSVVSGWRSGAREATEGQLKPLLELYGHQLRRNSFRVYWSLSPDASKLVFSKVEGSVILSQSFTDPRRQSYKLVKKIPVYRLVVHDQGKGYFRVVDQSRLEFQGTRQELECSHEDAIWNSVVGDRVTVEELLSYIDEYCQRRLTEYPSDAITLPFLIRKALLNHGHQVEGIAEFPAVW